MIESICVLGRQPKLGLAELESIFGSSMHVFSPNIAVIDQEDVDIDSFGGTLKVGRVLSRLQTTNWTQIQDHIYSNLINDLAAGASGKIKLGISVYGQSLHPKQVTAYAISLKKGLRSKDLSVRVIPNVSAELSTAQVQHNQLVNKNGIELLIASNQTETIIAKTSHIQNIAKYAARDQVRPKRDARIGMLPPKLAQIMINLVNPIPNSRLLDPFCGTGVILQESLLKGISAYGTDIDPRMIDYARGNLEWLSQNFGKLPSYEVEVADARNSKWQQSIDCVVSETYLGRPLQSEITHQNLENELRIINNIIKDFLKNISGQIKPGTKLCLAVPAWRQGNNFTHLPILDHLEEIGYNHLNFKTVGNDDLLYYRPQQLVARQLLVLVRK